MRSFYEVAFGTTKYRIYSAWSNTETLTRNLTTSSTSSLKPSLLQPTGSTGINYIVPTTSNISNNIKQSMSVMKITTPTVFKKLIFTTSNRILSLNIYYHHSIITFSTGLKITVTQSKTVLPTTKFFNSFSLC